MSTQQPFVLRGYHSDHSNPAVRSPTNLTTDHVGIELEVVARSHYRQVLSALPHPKRKNMRPLTEEDGSLPDDRGVEIIFPPFTIATLKRKGSYFSKVLSSIRPEVHDRRAGAGMHLNVSALSSPSANALFMAVLHNIPTSAMLPIFQRNTTHYCRQERGRCLSAYAYSTSDFVFYGNHSIGAIYRGGDYRGFGYIEVRFAASSVNHEAIVFILEFLKKVREFCEESAGSYDLSNFIDADTYGEVIYLRFLTWLKRKRKTKLVTKIINALET